MADASDISSPETSNPPPRGSASTPSTSSGPGSTSPAAGNAAGETDLFEGPPKRRNVIVRVGLIVLGALLVIAGVALGPVPVVPGFPLVIAGVLLLAASSGGARRGINRAERWLPERTRQLLRKALRRKPT